MDSTENVQQLKEEIEQLKNAVSVLQESLSAVTKTDVSTTNKSTVSNDTTSDKKDIVEEKKEEKNDDKPKAKLQVLLENNEYSILDEYETKTVIGKLKDDNGDQLVTVDSAGQLESLKLTKQVIVDNDLIPYFKVKVHNVDVYISKPFIREQDGKVAFIGFLEEQNKINMNLSTWYLSEVSQSWKVLMGYFLTEGKVKKVGQLVTGGKYGDTSCNLPIPLQKTLFEIIERVEPLVLPSDISELAFAGTAYSMDVYVAFKSGPSFAGAPLRKLMPKTVEENITLENEEDLPDFSKVVNTWKTTSKIYGNLTHRCFLSVNQELEYSFCEDDFGRVWVNCLDSTDNAATITLSGLSNKWIDVEPSLLLSAYEYLFNIPVMYVGKQNPEHLELYDTSRLLNKLSYIISYRSKFNIPIYNGDTDDVIDPASIKIGDIIAVYPDNRKEIVRKPLNNVYVEDIANRIASHNFPLNKATELITSGEAYVTSYIANVNKEFNELLESIKTSPSNDKLNKLTELGNAKDALAEYRTEDNWYKELKEEQGKLESMDVDKASTEDALMLQLITSKLNTSSSRTKFDIDQSSIITRKSELTDTVNEVISLLQKNNKQYVLGKTADNVILIKITSEATKELLDDVSSKSIEMTHFNEKFIAMLIGNVANRNVKLQTNVANLAGLTSLLDYLNDYSKNFVNLDVVNEMNKSLANYPHIRMKDFFKSVEETPATPEATQPTEQPKEIINEPNNNSNNIKNDKIWTKLIPGLKN